MSSELDKLDAAWKGTEPAPVGGGGDYEPIPAKTRVKVAIISQEPNHGKEKGTPYTAVTLEVQEGQYEKRLLWHSFFLTENYLKYLKRDLNLLGWKGEKVSSLMDASDFSLIGLGAEIEVEVETYFSQKHNENRAKNVVHFFAEPWTPPAPRRNGGDEDKPPAPEDNPFA